MADPNGAEAGEAFLAANKDKEGVITLPSGLQYKVLKEGTGMEHPLVGTPCECHYAGKLLDGSEFDSSYKRGPSTFAPNQVIKGWTEAMQLMVEGDKWEMYIPWNLAYGAAGKQPKIPAKACLIFEMEIKQIKGASRPIIFPEWTQEDLTLWTEKDESAVVAWREARSTKWEAGDEKLKASYPMREDLDAWMNKQSKSSKDKSLWKRTRTANNKAKSADSLNSALGNLSLAGEGGATPSASLTAATARTLLDKALAVFRVPTNKSKLEAIAKECSGDTGGMMKMIKLLPVVQELLAPTLAEYGFGADELMTVAASLTAFGATDSSIAADTTKLMNAAQGDLSSFQ